MTAPLTLRLADPRQAGNEPGKGPLAPGGKPAPKALLDDRDLPSTLSDTAKRQVAPLKLVRDLWDGDERVKAAGVEYLPKHSAEDEGDYRVRLQRAAFVNYYRNTIEGLAAFVFRRDPVLGDDVPATIREHWENIDLAGTHGDVWLYERLVDVLVAGHGAILVEFPKTDGQQSAADENPKIKANAIRPYWVPIRKEQILSWRTEIENGVTKLAQVVLQEDVEVPDGNFGTRRETQYRVFLRSEGKVGYLLFRIEDKKTLVQLGGGLYPTQDEIPIAEITTSGKRGLFDSTPPLLGVANLTVAHYQQMADYFHSLHMTCVPLLYTAGVVTGDQKIVVGPNTAIHGPPDAKVAYAEHSGAALGSVKEALDNLRADIATQGLAMLAPQKRVAETAEAKRIDKGTTDSKLGVTARGLGDATERALGFTAKYLKLPSGGSIAINRDFENMEPTPEMLNAWAGLVGSGFPKEEAVAYFKRAGLLSPDADEAEIVAKWQGAEDAQAELEEANAQARAASLLGMNGREQPKEPPVKPDKKPPVDAAA